MQTSFWTTQAAAAYQPFAVSLPSDRVAYSIAYHLLNPAEKAILDFGCFNGTSTNNIRTAGARSVTGVDINAAEIARAKLTYARCPELSFHHLASGQLISTVTRSRFDGAAMTFVHSTISDARTLSSAFKNIAAVTLEGGTLVLLGLHPLSFGPGCAFVNYSHRLAPGSTYADGQPFLNELKSTSGHCLQFIDYCWTEATLVKMLHESGFNVINSIGLKADSLDATVGAIFEQEIEAIATEEHLSWECEWTAPLYQLIVAEKQ